MRDDAGALIAGLSVSAPAEWLQVQWADAARATAGQISRAIGFATDAG